MYPPPKLVIFDCDGVLVDSETISISVLVDIIALAGGRVTEEIAYVSFLGRSMANVARILAADHDFIFTDQHLETMRARLAERFGRELKPIPGIVPTLERLACKRCVASSSGLDRIRLSLQTTGLWTLFDPAVFSASMVALGKPAPDLFLHAARQMGVAPADCVVIEDSPLGVQAAKAAGMRVFAFTGGSHVERGGLRPRLAALGPDLIFDDMTMLPDFFEVDDSRAKAS